MSMAESGSDRLASQQDLTSEEDYTLKLLGKYVFFDKISTPQRMACATCHDPSTGGTGGISGVNLQQVAMTGANPHTVGSLKPPMNAYASLIAPLQVCKRGVPLADGTRYCGGNFWNGRAEGLTTPLLPGATKHIGPEVFQGSTDASLLAYAKYFGPTADQALNPMPNPVEQNISRLAVCQHVAAADYAALYQLAWGEAIDCSDVQASREGPESEFDISFERLMLAVSAWQASSEVNSFSSRRDLALGAELACLAGLSSADPAVCNDPNYANSPGTFPLAGFTAQENLGHDLFFGKAHCSGCHRSDDTHADGTGLLERYTNDSYQNIGAPVNPELPSSPNPGLSGQAQLDDDAGVPIPRYAGGFKVPSLRNVDKRKGPGFIKAYGHNGWFKSLETLVHFYNTAKVKPCDAALGPLSEKDAIAQDCWPAPEWPETVTSFIGNLGLTSEEEAALVAYLRTLSDTYTATQPAPYKAK